jgi:hypothetical protein
LKKEVAAENASIADPILKPQKKNLISLSILGEGDFLGTEELINCVNAPEIYV